MIHTARAVVVQDPAQDRVSLFLVVDGPAHSKGNRYAITVNGQLSPIEDGGQCPPLLEARGRFRPGMRIALAAIRQAIEEFEGEPSNAHLEGRIEAMGKHLEDLRHLLKLPKK